MAGIKDYSTTQANNLDLNGISVAEGMLPSNLNNAIRALMKNTREWFNDSQWVEYGDGDGAYTATYASATSFTIAGVDVSAIYHEGRRIKLIATTPGTIYGTISSSTFSTDTTVNVTWDSGSLSNEAIDNIYIGSLSKTNNSIPTGVIATATLADGSVTTVKLANSAVTTAKIADANVTTAKIADSNITTAKIADSNVTTAKIADSNVTTAKILDANVTAAKLASNSVTTAKITDANVTTAKIADANVTNAKLATDAVQTSNIADGNVTEAKLANSSVTSAKIADGAIVNADINASAAIDATKIHNGLVSNTEFGYLDGVTSGIQSQLDAKLVKASNLSDLTSASTARTNLGLGTIATQAANNVNITGGAITGMSAPSSGSDVTTKTYVDDLVAGLKTRIITRAATTTNIDLTADLQNGDTLDGVTLATGNKVLVKDQTDQTQNGIYIVVASGTASRDPNFDTVEELAGQLAIVQEGSSNADKIYLCTTDNSGTIGSVNIVFSQVQPSFTGTVTSVAVADAGSSEFTVTGSPITSSGTISLAVNSINASKIGNGDVSNTELSYVNGVTSSIQTQIDNKASAGFAVAMAIAL
jgi:uncharacterized protein YjbI with pentapeptide repeats